MSLKDMQIDHLGYAVKRLERAISAFEQLGFAFEPLIEDLDRNVRICFGQKDGYRLELVSPLDRSKTSPVDAYLRGGIGTPYHICYQSEDLDADVQNLQGLGYKVVLEPQSAVAFGSRRVMFLMSAGFGLMEIVEV